MISEALSLKEINNENASSTYKELNIDNKTLYFGDKTSNNASINLENASLSIENKKEKSDIPLTSPLVIKQEEKKCESATPIMDNSELLLEKQIITKETLEKTEEIKISEDIPSILFGEMLSLEDESNKIDVLSEDTSEIGADTEISKNHNPNATIKIESQPNSLIIRQSYPSKTKEENNIFIALNIQIQQVPLLIRGGLRS